MQCALYIEFTSTQPAVAVHLLMLEAQYVC